MCMYVCIRKKLCKINERIRARWEGFTRSFLSLIFTTLSASGLFSVEWWDERWIGKDLEGLICRGLNRGIIPSICLERLSKSMTNPSQDSRYPGQESNHAPSNTSLERYRITDLTKSNFKWIILYIIISYMAKVTLITWPHEVTLRGMIYKT